MPASFSYAQPSEANSIVGGDVEQLKQRWPLLDYLQQQNWAARPAGYDSEFVGLCPLHQETRPSFYVNARKNLFYCHGCGQGGDLIRFVELSRHLSFRQSLAYLEQQSAPPVDSVDSQGRDTFYGRVVFPCSHGGRIVNLYGRSLGDAFAHRFLPRPKGGLYAWEQVRHCPEVILVEGLFDYAVLWQAGFHHLTCSL